MLWGLPEKVAVKNIDYAIIYFTEGSMTRPSINTELERYDRQARMEQKSKRLTGKKSLLPPIRKPK